MNAGNLSYDISGTYDFFGVNHYTTYLTTDGGENIQIPSLERDVAIATSQDPSWEGSVSFNKKVSNVCVSCLRLVLQLIFIILKK